MFFEIFFLRAGESHRYVILNSGENSDWLPTVRIKKGHPLFGAKSAVSMGLCVLVCLPNGAGLCGDDAKAGGL